MRGSRDAWPEHFKQSGEPPLPEVWECPCQASTYRLGLCVSHSTTITKAAKWSHKQPAYVTCDYRRLVLKPRPQGKPSDAIASNCIRNRASCDIKVGVAATIGYRLESRTARKFRTG